MKKKTSVVLILTGIISAYLLPSPCVAEESLERVEHLEGQIELLQTQINQQQRLILELKDEVESLKEKSSQPSSEVVQEPFDDVNIMANLRKKSEQVFSDNLIISGEGALGFFDTQADGSFPDSEFRIDEARLFLDAKLFDDGYLFTEVMITEREARNTDLRVGEIYVDLENISRWFGLDDVTNLRIGRFDIPFGEEYANRGPIENPLISHSLSDFWGIDEGFALYGRARNIDYIVALQNGGHPSLHDHDADKSVVARLGYEPTTGLRVSISAMRTGDLDVEGDKLSELWFGNGFIRSLGNPDSTTTFDAELLQADLKWSWLNGHMLLSGGYLNYDDNDPDNDNARDVYFFHVEGLQYLGEKIFAAARFSQITADDGFPIVGQGTFSKFFSESLTEDIWRLSLGLGFKWQDNFILKAEYSFEQGEDVDGKDLDNQDMLGLQAAYSF